MKDLFSDHAKDYANFRPVYPPALFNHIYENVSAFDLAWDCGTGNGQCASQLAQRFTKVYATDISEQQLSQAPITNNVAYTKEAAERISLPDHCVDLVTVAQAIHWFDLPAFYAEVNRVSKTDGVIAAWTYNLLSVNEDVDALISDFYFNTLEGYWDPERDYVDKLYENLPFPYVAIETPPFFIEASWMLAQLEGYLNTWSGVKKFIKVNKVNPVKDLVRNLEKRWRSDERKVILFPIGLKLAKISSFSG